MTLIIKGGVRGGSYVGVLVGTVFDPEPHILSIVGQFLLLLSVCLVLVHTVIEQLLVHIHQQLQSIVDEGVDRLVPMCLRVLVEGGEQDGHDDCSVLLHQTDYDLVVEEVQGSLRHLHKHTYGITQSGPASQILPKRSSPTESFTPSSLLLH